ERVGIGDGALRIVDEARLHGAPLLAKSILHLGGERPDIERGNALLALYELRLGAARIAELVHCTGVLRSIALSQRLAPLALPYEPADHGQHEHAHDDRDHGSLIHGSSSVCAGPPEGASRVPFEARAGDGSGKAEYASRPPARHLGPLRAVVTPSRSGSRARPPSR